MARFLPLLLLLSILAPAAWAEDKPEPRSVEDLLEDLGHPNYQPRRKAVLATHGRKEAKLLERLLILAKEDPHPNIRGYAAEALATFDDPRVVPLLIDMIKTRGPGERQMAMVALGSTKDPRGYEILLDGLSQPRGERGYAAKALGLLGDKRAFELIRKRYEEFLEDPYLNQMAPEALVILDRERGLAYCRKHFEWTPTAARTGLVAALAKHATTETREMMLGLIMKSEDAVLRGHALRVLRDVADASSVSGLLEALRAHPDDAPSIAPILGRLRDARALPHLTRGLEAAKKPRDRIIFIAALADLGEKGAVKTIRKFLRDESRSDQELRRSSVAPFPSNCIVAETAYWAILTLLDGRAPFDRSELLHFPMQGISALRAQQIEALEERLGKRDGEGR